MLKISIVWLNLRDLHFKGLTLSKRQECQNQKARSFHNSYERIMNHIHATNKFLLELKD